MDYVEKAKELFQNGYNCSQAVIGAYAEALGLDFETAIRLSSTFGGGIGKMREACGALTGMMMALGLYLGGYNPSDSIEKEALYRKVMSLGYEFQDVCGAITCRDLLSMPREGVDPERTSNKALCTTFVEEAARLMQGYMQDNPLC